MPDYTSRMDSAKAWIERRGDLYVPSQDLLPSLKVGFSPVQKWSGVKTAAASVAAWKLTFDEPSR